MKKSLILILSMFLLIPLVFAQDIPVGVINSSLEVYGLGDMPMSCYIGFCNVSPENLSFDYVGDVMLVGHVNQSLDLGSMLCCGKGFSYAKKYHGFDYGANFFVSSSGHFWNESLGEEFELGSGRDLVDLNINTGSCSTEVFVDDAAQNYGCAVSKEPVFRVSSSFNAHVGRLNGTVEGGFGGHAFKYVTCCDKLELCWDGLDNDLDGDIDCAD
ncbi:hypothetical protein K9M18_04265, partial [Candidatus Woesearchaeota archaeon]|nr:hypothetical protein [Candidatus Woesearchaeota archaeon]